MKELLDLDGIITVLNTPFTDKDTIDVDSLRRNVRLAIDAGVKGFLVPAMASEVGKLSEAERHQLVTVTLEEAAGRAMVIGGGSAPTDTERLRIARDLIHLGCDGVLVNIPYVSDEQFRRAVSEVAGLPPPFLMIQDWDFEGYGLPVDLIVRLFEEIEVFRCLKIEVVPAGVKYTEVLQATQGRLHLSGGWADTQMIEGLDRGVHGFMPTGMHRAYTRIHALYRQGDRDAAQALFERILPVLAFSNQHLDISIHFFKRLLHGLGIYATPRVREPILPFDAIHERITEGLIERVRRIEEELRT